MRQKYSIGVGGDVKCAKNILSELVSAITDSSVHNFEGEPMADETTVKKNSREK